MQAVVRRRSPESLLAQLQEEGKARLHVYIGAAAGVGKTYRMLEEAHDLWRQGVDVVLALIEPHGECSDRAPSQSGFPAERNRASGIHCTGERGRHRRN